VKKAFNLIRLAGLPLSITLITILAGSVINRVMVVELGLPVTLAGLFISIPLLVAPVRIWLGYISDAHPIMGLRREPYWCWGRFCPASARLHPLFWHGLPTSGSGALQFPDGRPQTAALEKNRRLRSAVRGQICKDILNHAK
jgi:hypothetical protein